MTTDDALVIQITILDALIPENDEDRELRERFRQSIDHLASVTVRRAVRGMPPFGQYGVPEQ